MINISTEYVIHKMSEENKPAACCQSGDMIAFHTLDCFSNKLLPEGTKLGADNPPLGNPATGPLYVQGAKPGDTLKVEIIDIKVGPLGVSVIGPSSESLSNRLDETKIRRIPITCDKAELTDKLSLFIKPMIGVIGVSPQDNAVPTALPGNHGGNMDCSQIKKGAALYLPVFVEGALLSIGDLHALMGDGEISECGLEIEGTVTVKVSVLSDTSRIAPALLVDGKWMTIASCKTLDEAAEEATSMMLEFLIDEVGMDEYDAGMIISLCGNLAICQKCNMYKTVRMELPLDCIAHTGFIPA